MKRFHIWIGFFVLSILTLICFYISLVRGIALNKVGTEGDGKAFEFSRMVSQNPTINPLPPDKSLQSFRLPMGYHLEIVASEPMISEPVAIAWDGNGRMFVAQLETYMQTIDAKGQNEAKSRIMLLEDTDNDGRMDKSSVFIDKLLSPRMLLCVGHELLVNETNTFDIYAYKDTNQDGIADQKRLVYKSNEKAYGNIEHQRSGLDWNLDNWIYLTNDLVRFKYVNGQLKVDSLIYGNDGQWGITHDNYGRLFYSRAGSNIPVTGFNINPIYGQLDFSDHVKDSVFDLVWPGIKTPDANAPIQPGDSTIRVFTSSCGQSIFRGDRLPNNMTGDYLVAEPVGRLIRRAKVIKEDENISLINAYEKDEFITSSDMNFRPVNTYTGPDGCLYIVDMYRGVIQESTWAQPGSPVYNQIKVKNLDRNINRGRIYRLVYDGLSRGLKPQMLNEPTSKLVNYLDHPNGWWRDNAQKEIIIRGDKSVVPVLNQISQGQKGPLLNAPSILARIHALWTLQGLDALTKNILLKVMDDDEVQVRKAAIWISEPYIKKGDTEIIEKLVKMRDDKSYEVRVQLLLSMYYGNNVEGHEVVKYLFLNNSDNKMIMAIQKMMASNEEKRKYGSKLVSLDEADRKMVLKGASIFNSNCVNCHGPEGQGLSNKVAPPIIAKNKLLVKTDGVIKILLHGLKGEVDGSFYPVQMPPMGANDDYWIASVLNYVRFDLSMKSYPDMPKNILSWVIVQPQQIEKIRSQFKGRKEPWTWSEIEFGTHKNRKNVMKTQTQNKK